MCLLSAGTDLSADIHREAGAGEKGGGAQARGQEGKSAWMGSGHRQKCSEFRHPIASSQHPILSSQHPNPNSQHPVPYLLTGLNAQLTENEAGS